MQADSGASEPGSLRPGAIEKPERPRAITKAALLLTVGAVPWLGTAALGAVPYGVMGLPFFLVHIGMGLFAYFGFIGTRVLVSMLVPLSCVLLLVPLIAALASLDRQVSVLALVLLIPTLIISVVGMAGSIIGLRLLYAPAVGEYLTTKWTRQSEERGKS